MDSKVAVDKLKMYKLIKLKKYKEAFLYIEDVRSVIELATKKRISQFLKEKIILKDEEDLFFYVVYNYINSKLLEDNNYVLMNEEDINCIKDKLIKFNAIKNKKRKSKVHIWQSKVYSIYWQ